MSSTRPTKRTQPLVDIFRPFTDSIRLRSLIGLVSGDPRRSLFPIRRTINARVIGQPADMSAVGVHDIDFWVPVSIGSKGNLISIRRENWLKIQSWTMGQID